MQLSEPTIQEFRDLRRQLHNHLTDDVIPFWLNHSIDEINGGLFTHLASDGSVIDRRKSMVSNTRALYTFSALCRRIENNATWRKIADNLFGFLSAHGRDTEGRWVFLVDEAGEVLVGENSIIVDAFAIMGLTEYYLLTGKGAALEMARETFASASDRLRRPGTYKTAPYPTPSGMRPHREAMQFSLAFAELGRAAHDEAILEAGIQLGKDVLDLFYRSDRGVLLEYLNQDNTPQDSPAGRCMVPGHAIESLWFQMHIFSRLVSDNSARARLAAACLRPCLDKGWDPEYGGILLGIDVDGRAPVYWKLATLKRWWPVTEALPACLMAWELLEEDWCLDWFRRIHQWSFARFPDKQNGDWYQNLTREGKPLRNTADLRELDEDSRYWVENDLMVKDPFHLPRGLIMSICTLDRIIRNATDQ